MIGPTLDPRRLLNPPDGLIQGFRFSVLFMAGGVQANQLDVRFQKVSGLEARVNTQPFPEGGQNLYIQKLPVKIEHQPLRLERGFVVGSPLGLEISAAMSLFQFQTSNVLVTLLGENTIPMAAWLFLRAYPVAWSVPALDAGSDDVLIETIELEFARMQIIKI